jgi:hypothetical protein
MWPSATPNKEGYSSTLAMFSKAQPGLASRPNTTLPTSAARAGRVEGGIPCQGADGRLRQRSFWGVPSSNGCI